MCCQQAAEPVVEDSLLEIESGYTLRLVSSGSCMIQMVNWVEPSDFGEREVVAF